jgi:ABC-type antimicrobial peptide transport system permease subunit
MAKFYFDKTNPIGRRFSIDDDKLRNQPIEIIGVAHDARDHELRGTIPRRFYVPIAQATEPVAVLNFEIRTAADTVPVAEAARKLIKDFNPNVPVNSTRTLSQLIERTIGSEILIAQLSSFFAGLALLLASVGLYGIMSYMVSGRTREIGIRMALGAQRSGVLWMILQEAAKLVAVGVVIGIPAALMGSRLLTTMLFGLRPTDPTSMVMVIGVLLVIALFAGYIPSRRATKVDPMVALRYE